MNAVRIEKPQRLVAVSFLLILAIGIAYGVLRNGGGQAARLASIPIAHGGTLKLAAVEPSGFNPNTIKGSGTPTLWAVALVYPSAFHIKPDYSVVMDSDLLESAELTSENPQTVVYRIKHAATWSDGAPVSADDFVFLWQNMNGEGKNLDAVTTRGYQDIESVTGSKDGKTVTVVFASKFADWRSLFSQAIVPSHYAKKQRGGWSTGFDKNPEKIPSAGPFRIERYVRGESLSLVRNDVYWGTKAHLDRIVYRFLPSAVTQLDALRAGEVALTYALSPLLDEMEQVKQLAGVRYQVNLGSAFEHFDFNFRNPLLADLRVRQAIALGLNRRELLGQAFKQFSDKGKILGNRLWMTGQRQYQDHATIYGNGDEAAARRLLEDAGCMQGPDGIYRKAGKRLSFRFSTTTGSGPRERQGDLFQAQMQRIGVEITIANLPADKLFGEARPHGDFDIINFASAGTPFSVSTNQDLYRTGAASNFGHYSSRKVDDLFEQAVSELDERRSADLANQIDQALWDDMVTIPLYQKPTLIAFCTGLANIADNVSPEGPFWNARDWGYVAKAD